MSACVPGLILQPLVENAIKYGVSRTNRPVTITIAAHEENGRLHLSVSDDGNTVPLEGDKGNGIGLANVRDRLTARFGEEAEIRWHRVQGDGLVRSDAHTSELQSLMRISSAGFRLKKK